MENETEVETGVDTGIVFSAPIVERCVRLALHTIYTAVYIASSFF